MQPYFSIIIPMFNRADLISRALNSCLAQDFENFEIIAVDDGSSDKTVDIVKQFTDPRIFVLCHEENRGVGPARNTGINRASGIWVILLDSDDELLPGALQLIHSRIKEVGENISRLAFMYQLDTGGFSPSPPLIEETWNYEGYIRWTEGSRTISDYSNVIKRSAFDKVRFPNNRALEVLFHMDFARHFMTKSCPDVVALLHSDADNRSLHFSSAQLIYSAQSNADQITELLRRHGEVLRQTSPSIYYEYIRGGATLNFLAGQRVKGLIYAAHFLSHRPFSLKTWTVIGFGLLGRKPLAWLKTKMSS